MYGGGGALGSYQAGVYKALAEANLHPDWVAGIAIGAMNSALIAGNAQASASTQAYERRTASKASTSPAGDLFALRV